MLLNHHAAGVPVPFDSRTTGRLFETAERRVLLAYDARVLLQIQNPYILLHSCGTSRGKSKAANVNLGIYRLHELNSTAPGGSWHHVATTFVPGEDASIPQNAFWRIHAVVPVGYWDVSRGR